MESAVIMVAYLVITSAIAMLASRQNKTSGDFFLGSAGFGVIFVITMTFSETIGGTATIGDSAEAMSSIGMAAIWSTFGIAVGCMLFVFLFGKFYRVMGATKGARSVASAYGGLFGRRTKAVVLVIVAIVYASMFALQPVAAAGLLAPLFGIDRDIAYIIMGVLFIVVACMGGLKGLAKMNKVHAFVMWFGLLLVAVLAVRAGGGLTAVEAQAPEGFMNPFNPGVATVLIWFVGAILSQMNSALMATIVLSANALDKARKGVVVAAILLLTFAIFPALIGVCAHAIDPTFDPQSALFLVAQHISPWLGGLCSIAIIAAIFSSAPSLLLVVGTTLTEDLYRGFIKPEASDKEVMRFAKISMIIIGGLAVALGFQTTSIFSQLISIFQIRSIVAVVLLLALVWPRVHERAVFWSMLIGGGLAAMWHFLGSPFDIQPLVLAMSSGTIVLVALTFTGKYKVSDAYRTYLECQKQYLSLGKTDVRINEKRIERLLRNAEHERIETKVTAAAKPNVEYAPQE